MLVAPFALVFLNCDLYIPQDFLRDRADRFPQRIYRVGCVEVEYRQKILMPEVFAGVDAAPCHYGVRRADGQRFLERYGYIKLVKILKEAALCRVAYIACVIIIVARRQLMRKAEYHISDIIIIRLYIVTSGEGFHDRLLMLRLHLPDEQAARVISAVVRVGVIENVAQAGLVGSVVDQGDAL
jgi:hypothetical protein